MDRIGRVLLLDQNNFMVATRVGQYFDFPFYHIPAEGSPEEEGIRFCAGLGLTVPKLYQVWSTLDGAYVVITLTGLWSGTLIEGMGYEWVLPPSLLYGPSAEFAQRLFSNIWEVF